MFFPARLGLRLRNLLAPASAGVRLSATGCPVPAGRPVAAGLRAAGGLLAAAGLLTAAHATSPPGPGVIKGSGPSGGVQAEHPRYGDRPDVQRFAQELAERHGWTAESVLEALAPARYLPRVTQLIMPPPAGTAKNWAAYRERFVEPKRLKAGVAFWQAHERELRRAEAEFGVPAWLVVGIIGVETYYGRHMGNFRVLDALTTLAFDFPSGRSDRSEFFRGELESLLVWTRREGRAAHTVKGSYAGAIGWGQFMPSSILRHAVDFSGDGHIDLERNTPDAIGSVARFIQAHGWQTGQATHFRVEPPTDEQARGQLLAPDIVPSFTPEEMALRGAILDERALDHTGALALVELQNGGAAPSYVAGTRNFYVVTRYNWSSYYALAVIELGQAVQAERERLRAAGTAAAKGAAAAKPSASTKATATSKASTSSKASPSSQGTASPKGTAPSKGSAASKGTAPA